MLDDVKYTVILLETNGEITWGKFPDGTGTTFIVDNLYIDAFLLAPIK